MPAGRVNQLRVVARAEELDYASGAELRGFCLEHARGIVADHEGAPGSSAATGAGATSAAGARASRYPATARACRPSRWDLPDHGRQNPLSREKRRASTE